VECDYLLAFFSIHAMIEVHHHADVVEVSSSLDENEAVDFKADTFGQFVTGDILYAPIANLRIVERQTMLPVGVSSSPRVGRHTLITR
jgi:hypothetical protein